LRREDKYASWTVQDLKARIQEIKAGKNVEHPTYSIASGHIEDNKRIEPIQIDASMPVYIHAIENPGYVKITGQQSYEFRQVNNGSLVIGMWTSGGDGKIPTSTGVFARRETFSAGLGISTAFIIASYPIYQDGAQHDLQPIGAEITAKEKPIKTLLVPVYDVPGQLIVGIFNAE
jgi:hypothetical protein